MYFVLCLSEGTLNGAPCQGRTKYCFTVFIKSRLMTAAKETSKSLK